MTKCIAHVRNRMTGWRILLRNRLPDDGAGIGSWPIRQDGRPEPYEPFPFGVRWDWCSSGPSHRRDDGPRQLPKDVFRRGLLSAGWKLLAVAGRPSPDALAQRGILVVALHEGEGLAVVGPRRHGLPEQAVEMAVKVRENHRFRSVAGPARSLCVDLHRLQPGRNSGQVRRRATAQLRGIRETEVRPTDQTPDSVWKRAMARSRLSRSPTSTAVSPTW